MEIVLSIAEKDAPRVLEFLARMAREGGAAEGPACGPAGRPAARISTAGVCAAPADPREAARAFFRMALRREGLDAGSASVEEAAVVLERLAREGRHPWLKAFPNGDLLVTKEVIGEMRRALGSRAPGNISALAETMPRESKISVHKLSGNSIRGIRLPTSRLAEWMTPERLERGGAASG